MLSGKLIHLVESHWDAITANALQHIRKDPDTTQIAALPEAELHEWAQGIIRNLGHWLTGIERGELGARYEALGRLRFEESVSLTESVRAFFIIKAKIYDFIQEQGAARTVTEIYAEEETEIRLGRYFDFLVCHVVAGYERALRHAAHLEAAHAASARRAHS